MIISLDFDNTFTADREFWLEFIELARKYQHTVVCVTSRLDKLSNREELNFSLPSYVEKFFCGDIPKEAYMRALNRKVDIWIDDTPEAIPENIFRIS
ncbi:MAG: hypothetical protein KDD03_13210 [Gelidibacter sp.]|nr:hypothetical protein [Gelidibacter sp.]